MEDFFTFEGSGLELFDLSDVLDNLGEFIKKLAKHQLKPSQILTPVGGKKQM